MNVFNPSNYNYYPNTAIELSIIAYEEVIEIPNSVKSNTNLAVCWGPAELKGSLGLVSYSKMFVANNSATGEYFVVIQGTNPFSVEAWTKEDFDVGSSQPFGNLPGSIPNVPPTALISQGTFNGMSDLISLVDPSTGQSIVTYFKSLQPKFIYVTGHSLGGTLAPTMFAYLNETLSGGSNLPSMAMWSFAGLTPGGRGFNTYFNSLAGINDQSFLWRIQNSLDVAPLLWGSFAKATDIYSAYGLDCEEPWSLILDALFLEADFSGVNYEQPEAGVLLPGEFDKSITSWYEQASHQHSSIDSYQKMVNAYYPL